MGPGEGPRALQRSLVPSVAWSWRRRSKHSGSAESRPRFDSHKRSAEAESASPCEEAIGRATADIEAKPIHRPGSCRSCCAWTSEASPSRAQPPSIVEVEDHRRADARRPIRARSAVRRPDRNTRPRCGRRCGTRPPPRRVAAPPALRLGIRVLLRFQRLSPFDDLHRTHAGRPPFFSSAGPFRSGARRFRPPGCAIVLRRAKGAPNCRAGSRSHCLRNV